MSKELKSADRGEFAGKLTITVICMLVLVIGTVVIVTEDDKMLPISILMSSALLSLGLLFRS